mmetsp:Transcript_7469/g.20470  ORF Transcript_7469/g.20470 Transcript_7469/m.20470 type:complete len:454 (-) Transcript_7469:15-1376(-)
MVVHECSCGFSCGTKKAFARHAARFEGQSRHVLAASAASEQGADEVRHVPAPLFHLLFSGSIFQPCTIRSHPPDPHSEERNAGSRSDFDVGTTPTSNKKSVPWNDKFEVAAEGVRSSLTSLASLITSSVSSPASPVRDVRDSSTGLADVAITDDLSNQSRSPDLAAPNLRRDLDSGMDTLGRWDQFQIAPGLDLTKYQDQGTNAVNCSSSSDRPTADIDQILGKPRSLRSGGGAQVPSHAYDLAFQPLGQSVLAPAGSRQNERRPSTFSASTGATTSDSPTSQFSSVRSSSTTAVVGQCAHLVGDSTRQVWNEHQSLEACIRPERKLKVDLGVPSPAMSSPRRCCAFSFGEAGCVESPVGKDSPRTSPSDPSNLEGYLPPTSTRCSSRSARSVVFGVTRWPSANMSRSFAPMRAWSSVSVASDVRVRDSPRFGFPTDTNDADVFLKEHSHLGT